ncbi:17940_t:CDS:2 [Gigaspora margarita]|uniref:17940_t:CDS:1 n=1 Tax=Gigaspora margarita TaxID=4874 RepID=A0ABN7UPE3_GIGMA|nr:17940_t:CDS:2 [Gigaspora margarita]
MLLPNYKHALNRNLYIAYNRLPQLFLHYQIRRLITKLESATSQSLSY